MARHRRAASSAAGPRSRRSSSRRRLASAWTSRISSGPLARSAARKKSRKSKSTCWACRSSAQRAGSSRLSTGASASIGRFDRRVGIARRSRRHAAQASSTPDRSAAAPGGSPRSALLVGRPWAGETGRRRRASVEALVAAARPPYRERHAGAARPAPSSRADSENSDARKSRRSSRNRRGSRSDPRSAARRAPPPADRDRRCSRPRRRPAARRADARDGDDQLRREHVGRSRPAQSSRATSQLVLGPR